MSVCAREFSNKMSALFTEHAVVQVYTRVCVLVCLYAVCVQCTKCVNTRGGGGEAKANEI